MKISEMTNDQATEAMIRISVPLSNICDDDELVELMEELNGMSKEKAIKTIGKMVPKFVMYAFRKHRNDLYEIIGALNMTPAELVGRLNFRETVNMIRDSYDDILKDFFTSSVKQTEEAGS